MIIIRYFWDDKGLYYNFLYQFIIVLLEEGINLFNNN